MAGPALRTDVVDVYVARRSAAGPELLQLRRARPPLQGTWQPVMGHVEPGETAVRAAVREAREETGLRADDAGACLGFWALEQVHPFYMAAADAVVLSPRFLMLVPAGWAPALNGEHTAARWVLAQDAAAAFTWPGQRAAVGEIVAILDGPGEGGELLRVDRSLW